MRTYRLDTDVSPRAYGFVHISAYAPVFLLVPGAATKFDHWFDRTWHLGTSPPGTAGAGL